MSAFRFTDEEWRAYQQVPDQGYSHRAFLERIVNKRLASRPVTDAEVEAACDGFYTHSIATWSGLVNGDPELADRYRVWMREALEAARALADKETP